MVEDNSAYMGLGNASQVRKFCLGVLAGPIKDTECGYLLIREFRKGISFAFVQARMSAGAMTQTFGIATFGMAVCRIFGIGCEKEMRPFAIMTNATSDIARMTDKEAIGDRTFFYGPCNTMGNVIETLIFQSAIACRRIVTACPQPTRGVIIGPRDALPKGGSQAERRDSKCGFPGHGKISLM